MIALLKRLWREEPVVVRVGLALAVSGGVLTATQASTLGDAIAAVINAVALLSARGKVKPTDKRAQPRDAGQGTLEAIVLGAILLGVLILLLHGHIT